MIPRLPRGWARTNSPRGSDQTTGRDDKFQLEFGAVGAWFHVLHLALRICELFDAVCHSGLRPQIHPSPGFVRPVLGRGSCHSSVAEKDHLGLGTPGNSKAFAPLVQIQDGPGRKFTAGH